MRVVLFTLLSLAHVAHAANPPHMALAWGRAGRPRPRGIEAGAGADVGGTSAQKAAIARLRSGYEFTRQEETVFNNLARMMRHVGSFFLLHAAFQSTLASGPRAPAARTQATLPG